MRQNDSREEADANGRGKETKREIEEKREALNIGSEESKQEKTDCWKML